MAKTVKSSSDDTAKSSTTKTGLTKGDAIKPSTAKTASSKPSAAKSSTAGAAKYTAPALEKGLDILEVLSSCYDGYTLNEIAKMLDRSMNEIFRMVITLERRGWVTVDENDRYSLTLHMFHLAHQHLPLRSLVSMAMPLMRQLVSKARQSCHLTVLQDGKIVVIAQIDGPERWSFGLKVGAIVGLRDTASGHVLLAFRDKVERKTMLEKHANVEGETNLSYSKLEAMLKEVHDKGYAETPSQQVKGITNIAYPVFGPDNKVIACLNVPYVERVDMGSPPTVAEVKTIVDSYAKELSELMGHSSYVGN